MARILVHALVRIHAYGAGIGEPEGASRLQPIADQVARQPLAQA